MLCFPKAKINLGLYVLNKRSDGFHNIETIMLPIQLHDSLEVSTISSKTEIIMYGANINIPLEKNLIYKAWKLLTERHSIEPVLFHLVKQIPSEAGLGGGSSDAAGALILLNNFFNLKLSNDLLKRYASEIGSDCAFFIESKPALAQGRGEILRNINVDLSKYTIVVVKPNKLSDNNKGVSTAHAFSLVEPVFGRTPLIDIISCPIRTWRSKLFNDFEKPIINKYPQIGEIINHLYESGAIYASLSGSGSACFGIFETKNPALNLGQDFYVNFTNIA
jgi:4-diphosphocytidyl-2-C-methyl-D-erythritol kinase